jgi:hypothetical protein
MPWFPWLLSWQRRFGTVCQSHRCPRAPGCHSSAGIACLPATYVDAALVLIAFDWLVNDYDSNLICVSSQ